MTVITSSKFSVRLHRLRPIKVEELDFEPLAVLTWEAAFKWEGDLECSILKGNIVPVQSGLLLVRATSATIVGSRDILRPIAGDACGTRALVRERQWYRDRNILWLSQSDRMLAGVARAAVVLFKAAGVLGVEELAVIGDSWRAMFLDSAHRPHRRRDGARP